ncbi:MAG: GNAT family N-acetyltransferase [Trueperaceae bacterium]|nr:GNAT family N-acetyltransferase [Trueperaceae bacterium]
MKLEPAYQFAAQDLCAIFNDAFAGYVGGEIHLDSEKFQAFCSSQGVNLTLSRVLVVNSESVGIALIARRGWTSRLVAMGIRTAHKHKGLGFQVMRVLLAEAKERQDHFYELEVIEQNPAAVKLYQKSGFYRQRRLLEGSFQHSSEELPSGRLEAIDIAELSRELVSFDQGLPWQISGFNLVTLGEPNRAYRFDHALAIISSPELMTVRLHFFGVKPDYRHQSQGKRLWQALLAMHPGKLWTFPALCPEEAFEFFENQGFERGKLSQFQMRCDLKG